jgi:hypothetical protein
VSNNWSALLFVFFSAAFFPDAAAQQKVPLLERTVTVSLLNEPLDNALRKIGDAGNFNFSYKSSLLDKDEKVTFEFVNKSVREVLDQIFRGAVTYRERGRHIILVKGEKPTSKESSVLSGYVIDEATGKRLQNVSVYDPVSLNSAVTDAYGFFKIEVKNPTGEEVKLAINKKQYADTLVVVPGSNRRLLNIPIRLDKERLALIADSVGSKIRRFWIATVKATEQAANMENIRDTIYRTSQFSVGPFIGTNGKLSGNVINDYSLNLLGGYSLGSRKVEIGGLFNAVRGDVSGFQAGGLANGVAGKQKGVQLAGLANGTLDSAKGIQIAGLANINARSGTGVRFTGGMNFMMATSSATQVAGIANFVIGEQHRPQLAGLFNFTAGSSNTFQVAGIFNFAGRDVYGGQISGVLNIAPKTMKGIQIGLINFGRWSQGSQVGFINISNRMKGIPVGFLSLVGKGYHKLEIAADEVFYTNLSFRTGVHQFYNIFTIGAKPDSFAEDGTLWTFGYGIGTAPKITKWLSFNFDVTSNQIVDGNTIEKINLLNKAYGGFDFHLSKNFSIVLGVTLNGLVTDSTYEKYPEIFSRYTPEIIKDRTFSNDLNLKSWWGAKAGLRFF